MSLNNIAVTSGSHPSYELANRDDQQQTNFAEAKAKNVTTKCQTLGASLGSGIGGLIGGGLGFAAGYFLSGLLMPPSGANDIKTTHRMVNVALGNGTVIPKNETIVLDSLGQCQMRETAKIAMGAGTTFGVWVGGMVGAAIGSYIGTKC